MYIPSPWGDEPRKWQSSGLEQKGGSWVNFSEGGVGGDQRDPPRDRKMGTLWIRTEMWPICAYERMHVWLWPPTGMKLSEAKPPALYALSPRFFSGSIPAWRNTRTCRASSLSYVRLCFITCPGLDNGSVLLFFLFFYSQASVFFPLFFKSSWWTYTWQWKLLVGRFQLVSTRKQDKLAVACAHTSHARTHRISLFLQVTSCYAIVLWCRNPEITSKCALFQCGNFTFSLICPHILITF